METLNDSFPPGSIKLNCENYFHFLINRYNEWDSLVNHNIQFFYRGNHIPTSIRRKMHPVRNFEIYTPNNFHIHVICDLPINLFSSNANNFKI